MDTTGTSKDRRWLIQSRGWAIPILAAPLLCLPSACTLFYDTDAVPFDRPGEPEGLPEAEPDERPDSGEPEPEMRPVEGLGRPCGIDVAGACLPESEDWPLCADLACAPLGQDASCVMNEGSLIGYCTLPCAADADCIGAPDDAFASSMRCVVNPKGVGLCLPGSQAPCATDAACPEGELCKQAMTLGDELLELRSACQTATTRGADRGQYCNDDPRRASGGLVKRCANDLCLDDVCAALCDPAEDPDEDCGNPNLACQSLGGGPIAGRCSPKICAVPADCSGFGEQPPICTSAGQPRLANEAQGGRCRTDNPGSEGSRRDGEDCLGLDNEGDPSRCGSRMCVGRTPFFYCSSLCDNDGDCGQGLVCAISRLSDEQGPYFLKACTYAPGSRTRCDADGVGEGCPQGEVCAPFLFGDVAPDGAHLSNASVKALCIDPVPGGVAVGSACEERGCLVSGACVSTDGEAGLCTTACASFLDCPELQTCGQVTMLRSSEHLNGTALNLGFCLSLF